MGIKKQLKTWMNKLGNMDEDTTTRQPQKTFLLIRLLIIVLKQIRRSSAKASLYNPFYWIIGESYAVPQAYR